MDIGPNKNVVKELKQAFVKNAPDVHFGLYYNLWEPFHPIFLKDKEYGWTPRLLKFMYHILEFANKDYTLAYKNII